MMRPNSQNGCIPHQRPAYIIDAQTGEMLDEENVNRLYVLPFLEYVRDKTKETVDADKANIISIISNETKVKQPTGLAWKHNIRPDLSDIAKQGVLAQSRIEKIIQHRVVSELASYVNNPNPKKEEPTFDSLKANLGAADKQICSVEYDTDLGKVTLVWKCWTREIVFIFDVPDFALEYAIEKFSLPSIRFDEASGQVTYDIPFTENLDYSKNEFHHCYGAYDSGRVIPYFLTFKNHKGAIIASYKASGMCRVLNSKRERILGDVKNINAKLCQYDALQLPDDYPKRLVLKEEKRRLKAKAKALGEAMARLMGHEVAKRCAKQGAAVVAAEDLSWINDAHGSSRWNHSVQQLWVAREVQRAGIAFMTVSAKNSSQICSGCGSKNVTHDSSKRLTTCEDCHLSLDRDESASRVLCDRATSNFRKYMAKVALSRMRMRC